MKPSAVAAVSLVCAFVGAGAALIVAQTTDWLEDPATTVVVRDSGGASSAPDSESDAGQPLVGNGFDPAVIYRERAGGVVTVLADFGAADAAAGEPGGESQGSGFVVSHEGYILTNSHVITTAGTGSTGADVRAASRVYVEFKDGDRVAAKVVGWDLFDDVALLKVDPEGHDLQPLPLGDSSQVEVGEPVAAIGSPFGQESSLSVGVVAATKRSIASLTSQYSLVDAIQTDAPINPGNSGGPLVDARGRVIGLNAQIRSTSGTAEGVGFAVPINSAVRSMDQLIADGRVRYAWVGITTQTVTPTLAAELGFGADRGAAVQQVVDRSPAEAADLRAGKREVEFEGIQIVVGGDVIVAIDDTPVLSAEDVVREVSSRLPGEEARFTIVRDGKRLVVKVRFADRPAEFPLEN
jgi:S1-C subfamily serine protease